MIPKTRHLVPVFLFVIFVIFRGAQIAAQTPSTTSTTQVTTASIATTNGTVSVTIPFQVIAPPGCAVAFSSSGTVPVINVTGCAAATPPSNPNPPTNPPPPSTPLPFAV